MRLEKDLYVTEIRISKTLNVPFLIEAVGGKHESSLTLNRGNLEAWGIEPSTELLGNGLVVTLESRPLSPIPEETDLFIDSLEKNARRKFSRAPIPQLSDEIEFVLRLQTPRGDSHTIPCPYFEINLDLDEAEYLELIGLPPDTGFQLSARSK